MIHIYIHVVCCIMMKIATTKGAARLACTGSLALSLFNASILISDKIFKTLASLAICHLQRQVCDMAEDVKIWNQKN